jgi:type II secretory pathway pseudopilin PulG
LNRRAGFMLPELIFALALLVVAAGIWTTWAVRVRRADLELADARDASRIVEQTLIALRSGQTPPRGSQLTGAGAELKSRAAPGHMSRRRSAIRSGRLSGWCQKRRCGGVCHDK